MSNHKIPIFKAAKSCQRCNAKFNTKVACRIVNRMLTVENSELLGVLIHSATSWKLATKNYLLSELLFLLGFYAQSRVRHLVQYKFIHLNVYILPYVHFWHDNQSILPQMRSRLPLSNTNGFFPHWLPVYITGTKRTCSAPNGNGLMRCCSKICTTNMLKGTAIITRQNPHPSNFMETIKNPRIKR